MCSQFSYFISHSFPSVYIHELCLVSDGQYKDIHLFFKLLIQMCNVSYKIGALIIYPPPPPGK